MSARTLLRRLLLVPLVVVVLGASGCGKRGPLYLPSELPDEVSATQQGDSEDGEQQASGTGG